MYHLAHQSFRESILIAGELWQSLWYSIIPPKQISFQEFGTCSNSSDASWRITRIFCSLDYGNIGCGVSSFCIKIIRFSIFGQLPKLMIQEILNICTNYMGTYKLWGNNSEGKRSATLEWLLITQAKSMCVKKSDSQNKNAHSLHY